MEPVAHAMTPYKDHPFFFEDPGPGAEEAAASNLWDTMCARPGLPWRFRELSGSPGLDWSVVRRNPNRGWDWRALSGREDLDPHIVIELHDKLWDWRELSNNPAMPVRLVRENPTLPWVAGMSQVPDDVRGREYTRKEAEDKLCFLVQNRVYGRASWATLSRSAAMPIEEIASHPGLPWCWDIIGWRKDVDADTIRAHPGLPWRWDCLPASIGAELGLEMPERPWNWDAILRAARPGAHRVALIGAALQCGAKLRVHEVFHATNDWHIVYLFPDRGWWNWRQLGANAPWWLIMAFPSKSWPWKKLSQRGRVPWGFVIETKHRPWNWKALARCPTLTWDVLWRFREELPMLWKEGAPTRPLAAQVIKRAWLRCYYDPSYQVCIRRLHRGFAALCDDIRGRQG